jgi:hypothetical protein
MARRNTSADADSRTTRESEDRSLTENRALTDEQRLTSFRHALAQGELPAIPSIDGYHVCWLTTTNSRDTIASRLRIGYELIRTEEVPGMEHVGIKTGEYAGCIGVNEMLAAKIPLRLYHMYMQDAHHDQPMQNAQGIYDTIQSMQDQAQESKGRLEVEPGFENLKADQRIAQFDN